MASLVPGDVDVLVVASHPPHVAGLRALLGESLSGVVRNVRIAAKTVGVGAAAAGASATRRIMQVTPRAVVHVGSAYAYPGNGFERGDVIVANRFVLTDGDLVTGRARFPEPMQSELVGHAVLAGGIAHNPQVRRAAIASPMAMTEDESLARAFAEHSRCGAENLEAFAIATACALMNVAFASVLGIAETTASPDRTQHDRSASEAACSIVAAWAQSGSQGLPPGV